MPRCSQQRTHLAIRSSSRAWVSPLTSLAYPPASSASSLRTIPDSSRWSSLTPWIAASSRLTSDCYCPFFYQSSCSRRFLSHASPPRFERAVFRLLRIESWWWSLETGRSALGAWEKKALLQCASSSFSWGVP